MIRIADFSWRCLAMLVVATGVAHAQDPFAAPSAPADGPAGSTAAAAVDACTQLSEAMCSSANRTFLFMVAGYVLVATIIAVVWNIVWSSRGAGNGTLKFALPLVIGALAAALAVGFDPFASENYVCCLANPTFRVSLLLGESKVARAIVVGLLPFGALYVISVFVVKIVRR